MASTATGWRGRTATGFQPFYIKNSLGVPDTAQRVHWDTELAQQTTGNPLPYDYGVMRETWLHHFLTNWAGDDAWIEYQYDEVRKFNYMGDVQIITGKVVDKRLDNGRCVVDLEIETRSQRDVVCTICRARVVLPSREHGPAQPPAPSDELRRRIEQMLKRHRELLSAGGSPPRGLLG